jgi:hypothetical protein
MRSSYRAIDVREELLGKRPLQRSTACLCDRT